MKRIFEASNAQIKTIVDYMSKFDPKTSLIGRVYYRYLSQGYLTDREAEVVVKSMSLSTSPMPKG